jgi:hypothetical protein
VVLPLHCVFVSFALICAGCSTALRDRGMHRDQSRPWPSRATGHAANQEVASTMSQSELASNNSGTSRRRFLQWSGAAAAGLGWAGSAFGPALAARAQEAEDKAPGGKAVKLGQPRTRLAS